MWGQAEVEQFKTVSRSLGKTLKKRLAAGFWSLRANWSGKWQAGKKQDHQDWMVHLMIWLMTGQRGLVYMQGRPRGTMRSGENKSRATAGDYIKEKLAWSRILNSRVLLLLCKCLLTLDALPFMFLRIATSVEKRVKVGWLLVLDELMKRVVVQLRRSVFLVVSARFETHCVCQSQWLISKLGCFPSAVECCLLVTKARGHKVESPPS